MSAMEDQLHDVLVDSSPGLSSEDVQIAELRRLSGGANMETWSFDLVSPHGKEPLILRRLPGGAAIASEMGELSLADEAALLRVANRHEVAVPAVRCVLNNGHPLGVGYIMKRERGEALPFRLLRDDCYHEARQQLAYQCGQQLGRIHQIPLEALPSGLPDYRGKRLFQRAQEQLDSYDNGSPILQLGLNWLREHPRTDPATTLVHGDFRNGNLLVDEQGLVAVLDWELAHLGDPVQDLGYLCANVWRFGYSKPVGGFGEYTDLLAGYSSVEGNAPPMADIHYWQVHAALSWGTVCLVMLDMYRSGMDATLERAAVGRRLSEAEIDLLVLLEGEWT